ncbi:hypothetical protein [Acrocarpospora catenulata]|uniref:hypothetical protein n=1 Tax=Acrocarpospora catenulata TaxID=2836182 RepID=UPI001BDA7E82|nr:hypothetical protein [Acrocarpospora catenulata]
MNEIEWTDLLGAIGGALGVAAGVAAGITALGAKRTADHLTVASDSSGSSGLSGSSGMAARRGGIIADRSAAGSRIGVGEPFYFTPCRKGLQPHIYFM